MQREECVIRTVVRDEMEKQDHIWKTLTRQAAYMPL